MTEYVEAYDVMGRVYGITHEPTELRPYLLFVGSEWVRAYERLEDARAALRLRVISDVSDNNQQSLRRLSRGMAVMEQVTREGIEWFRTGE